MAWETAVGSLLTVGQGELCMAPGSSSVEPGGCEASTHSDVSSSPCSASYYFPKWNLRSPVYYLLVLIVSWCFTKECLPNAPPCSAPWVGQGLSEATPCRRDCVCSLCCFHWVLGFSQARLLAFQTFSTECPEGGCVHSDFKREANELWGQTWTRLLEPPSHTWVTFHLCCC